MRSLSRLIGLPICCHDRTGLPSLDLSYRLHIHPACAAYKNHHEQVCVSHDAYLLHRRYAGREEVLSVTCHAELTQWIRPLIVNGVHGGILFAGPVDDTSVEGDDKKTIEEKKRIMDWCASRMEGLMETSLSVRYISDLPVDRNSTAYRQRKLINYIEENLTGEISLQGGAAELSLSPSRLSHLMKELFDCTFPRLVDSVRLNRARALLEETDLSVGEIARLSGFNDPDYFSKCFAREFGMGARKYRLSLSDRKDGEMKEPMYQYQKN